MTNFIYLRYLIGIMGLFRKKTREEEVALLIAEIQSLDFDVEKAMDKAEALADAKELAVHGSEREIFLEKKNVAIFAKYLRRFNRMGAKGLSLKVKRKELDVDTVKKLASLVISFSIIDETVKFNLE